MLFRTRDGGQTWTAISGDLTRDDETKQRWSGGPITGDNTGAEYYGTIFAVAESPREKGLIWAGTDDGLVHVTRDGGQTWTNVTANIPGLSEWGTVAAIEPSPFDAAVAYVVVDAHRMDDVRPYLWKTADYGKTWRSLDAGLPRDVYLHAVREDPKSEGPPLRGNREGRLVLARRRRDLEGAPAQPADGGRPRPRGEGRRPRGRHPRALDLDPRRPHAAARVVEERGGEDGAPLHGAPGERWHYDGPVSSQVKGPGQNPPVGAVLHYWLKDEPKDDVVLEILDEKGGLVRKLSSRKVEPETPPDDPDAAEDDAAKKALPKKAGLQRAVWDLRYEGATKIRAAKVDSGDPAEGPMVLPGTYTLRLTVDGQSLTTPVEVRLDPRVSVSRADLEEQLAFSLALRDDLTRLSGIVHDLRSVREQVKARSASLQGVAGAAPLAEAAAALAGEVRRPGGEAPQPEGRGDLRHPRHAGRGEALLAPRAALLGGPRRRRPADPGHARRATRS